MKYRHTPEMGEISGFGGGYEACCQDMLEAGLHWSEDHPAADPLYQGFKNIDGIMIEDNEDAKALAKAVIDAAKGEATGAMHQAVISRVLYIRKNGWGKYEKKTIEHKRKESA